MPRTYLWVAVAVALAGATARADESELELFQLDEEVRETVTTITKTRQEVRESPAVVTIVNKDDIRARGYRSVAEIVRDTTGVDVIDDHVSPDIGMRGVHGGPNGSSRLLKIMIDGQPVPFRPTSGYQVGPELIPVEIIERVEIIRGPVSALYGANAFLGVINIVTQTGSDLDAIGIGARVSGMQGEDKWRASWGVSAVAGAHFKKLDIMAALTYDDSSRSGLALPASSPSAADYPMPRLSADDHARPLSFYARLTYDAGAVGTFRLSGGMQHTDSGAEFVSTSVLASDDLALTHRTRVVLDNRYVRLQWNKKVAKLELEAWVSYAQGGTGGDDLIDVRSTSLDRVRVLSFQAITGALEARWQPKRVFSLVLGVDIDGEFESSQRTYSKYQMATGPYNPGDLRLVAPPVPDQTYTNFGAYLQLIYNPRHNVGLTGGFRFDESSLYREVFSGRFATVYTFGRNGFLKALFGTSYKAPSHDQLRSQPIYEGALAGNPNLRKQYALTGELTAGYDFLGHLQIAAVLFYTHIIDKVEFVPTSTALAAGNVGTLDDSGLELELRYRHRSLRGMLDLDVWLNGAWIFWADKQSNATSVVANVAESYPSLIGNLGVDFSVPRWHVRLNAVVHAAGPAPSSGVNTLFAQRLGGKAYELSPYAALDVTLSTVGLRPRGLKELIISLRGSNLAGGYVQPGTGGVDIPSLGRSVLLQAMQKF